MKLLTPPIKDCRYIHKKLRQFYKEQKDNEYTPDTKEFERALKRFCDFYKLWLPKVEWYKELGQTLDGKITLGLCHKNGKIQLIAPHYWRDGGEWNWLDTVYHELAHYVMWANAEIKARQFSKRMMEKWKK